MSGPDNPEQSKPVEDMLSSPEFARAVENEDFKRFLDHVPVGIAVSRQAGQGELVVYANPAFEAMTGAELAALKGKVWAALDSFSHEDEQGVTLGMAAAGREDFLGTFRRERPAGKLAVLQAYVGVIENDDGGENYRVVALIDVTEFERSQREDYETQIRDIDLQLKELQHRVKNNLQLITALIRLESRSVQRGAKVDLDRLAGRVESLSLLYRTMEADSFGPELDLGHYISQIATASLKTHAVEGIELETRVGYAPVSVNVAMPVGLIVNELLTNAFKYAFEGRERGKLTIETAREGEDQYRIVVADDGVGLEPGMTWPMPGKLAALVIQTLRENARNLTLAVDSEAGQGMRVTIAFTHLAPSARPN